jgi:hypothetical protein
MRGRDFGPQKKFQKGAKRLHRGRRYDAELVHDVCSMIRH